MTVIYNIISASIITTGRIVLLEALWQDKPISTYIIISTSIRQMSDKTHEQILIFSQSTISLKTAMTVL